MPEEHLLCKWLLRLMRSTPILSCFIVGLFEPLFCGIPFALRVFTPPPHLTVEISLESSLPKPGSLP